MLSFFGWKWANVFFYIFLIWICSGLLLHLCIFHIYITLNDLTTYEYVRAQRDETGRDRYRILPSIWGKREKAGRDRYRNLDNIWGKREEAGRDKYRNLDNKLIKREETGRDRYIHLQNIWWKRNETGRDRYRILPKISGKREITGRDSKNLEVQGFEYTVFHSDVLKFIFNTLTPQSQTLCNVHDTAVSSSMVSLAHWVKLCSVIDTAESESIVSI